MSSDKRDPYKGMKNLSANVTNFFKQKSTPYIITNEGAFYEVQGVRIPEDVFENMYPIVNENNGLDGRSNWY